MYILSPSQIKKVDKETIEKKSITSIQLMEFAGTSCFNWLHQRLQNKPVNIHVFCGIGNNGGDGLVVTRKLLENNYNTTCYIVNFSQKRTNEFLENYNILREMGHWPIIINNENEFPKINNEEIIIDSIFGNGLKKAPEDFTKKLIIYLNNSKAFILSIDSPSGLFSNKSITDKAAVVKSNHILTFQSPKLAFLLPENKEFVKTWDVLDIGLDCEVINNIDSKIEYFTKTEAQKIYKFREKWSHKGTYGHALLIGGSYGKIGAITLTTKGALKIGSGLVTAYIPKCGYEILQISVPEVMVEVDNDNLLTYFNPKTKASVIGIGPGMGTETDTEMGFEKFLKENKISLVIDADALNLLAKKPALLKFLPRETILTPHIKELERLIGSWQNDYEMLEKATLFSQKHDIILVIKNAHSIIVKNNRLYFNSTGNPALATGGSGDVLTGIITGLLAQNYSALDAALLGVYLHGKTADLAITELSCETFTASVILDFLSDAILDLVAIEEKPVTEKQEGSPTKETPKEEA